MGTLTKVLLIGGGVGALYLGYRYRRMIPGRGAGARGSVGAGMTGAPAGATARTVPESARGDPLTNPAIATIPVLPTFFPPAVRPLGVSPPPPVGIGVIAAAGAPLRGSPPPPPPSPPPPIPVATSVGTLYFPPGISQQAALSKVADLAAQAAAKPMTASEWDLYDRY